MWKRGTHVGFSGGDFVPAFRAEPFEDSKLYVFLVPNVITVCFHGLEAHPRAPIATGAQQQLKQEKRCHFSFPISVAGLYNYKSL